MTFKDLKALHSIIGAAIAELEARFQKELGEDFDYPSLDTPYENTSASHVLSEHPSVVSSANRIIAAADHLIAAVRSPFSTIVHSGMAFLLPVCLREVEAAHVVETLRGKAGDSKKGLPVEQIAAYTGRDPSKLGHILRFLATHHIFREVTPNCFANNRTSSYLDTGKKIEDIILSASGNSKYEGTSGMAAFIAVAGDEFLKSASHLSEVMRHPQWARSRLPNETAFNAAWSTDKGFFEFMQDDVNKERLGRLGHAFRPTEQFSSVSSIVNCFPWDTLHKDAVVVDVGGGSGRAMRILVEHFKHLKYIVQDLPRVCERGRERAEDTGTIVFQDHDFFKPQPISDAAVFYLRTVLHDWSDSHAINILRLLRDVAQPTTRLVIGEHLLLAACPDDGSGDQKLEHHRVGGRPPAPLLMNLGIANSTVYASDLNMHVLFNGQDRMLNEVTRLTEQSGWKIETVYTEEVGLFTHFVAIPA